MTYIENIFICMVSPLLVAALCMGRRQLRFFLFCIAGMGVCLLSAYINTFLAAVCQAVSYTHLDVYKRQELHGKAQRQKHGQRRSLSHVLLHLVLSFCRNRAKMPTLYNVFP